MKTSGECILSGIADRSVSGVGLETNIETHGEFIINISTLVCGYLSQSLS